MWISNLKLSDFRCYTEAEVHFEPGFNLIFGNNGLGKTNLVEAIYFSSAFESHRTPTATHLINNGAISGSITAELNANGRAVTQLTTLTNPAQTRVWVNGSPKKKLSEAIGTTSAVMFSPEDLDTIRRDPSDRRRFIDQVVIQFQPRLAGVKVDYERALRQRNALLKSLKAAGRRASTLTEDEHRSLRVWDDKVVHFGSTLTAARVRAIEELTPGFARFYREISGVGAAAEIRPWLSVLEGAELESPDEFEAMPKSFNEADFALEFARRLEELRVQELERGVTLVGPHRDDLIFYLDGLAARFGSSQGEAWSLALGAKLALASLLSQKLPSGSPILLLDDVFSVLDPARRERLLSHLADYEQVIITATTKAGLPDLSWSRLIELSAEAENQLRINNEKIEIEASQSHD